VGPRASLDAEVRRKILCLCHGNLNKMAILIPLIMFFHPASPKLM
jgi:hypothetical protein